MDGSGNMEKEVWVGIEVRVRSCVEGSGERVGKREFRFNFSPRPWVVLRSFSGDGGRAFLTHISIYIYRWWAQLVHTSAA